MKDRLRKIRCPAEVGVGISLALGNPASQKPGL